MKNIKQALAVFIIGFCILIMWLELILILAKNGLIVKILASLFQQNFDIIVSIISILSLLCAIILSMAFYWAMQVHNVFNVQKMAHNMFSGKTKAEVLEIVFKESSVLSDDGLNIMTATAQQIYSNYCYKNLNEAVNDEKLMTAEIWRVNVRKRSKAMQQYEIEVEVYFENGKVARDKVTDWSLFLFGKMICK